MSAGKDGEFKSFKDMLRSKGDGEAAPEPPAEEERGWTLDTGEHEVDAADVEELEAEGAGARELFSSRPAAFGPMEAGPPPYRDTQSEEMELMASFRVRTIFPEDVEAEVGSLPDDPTPADWSGRVDLRDEQIFTIDGEDAKDFDDAISIKALADGALEVGVHIADVSHYVVPGTALDGEAMARATSVYLADQVVPMLPEKISNGLCSLRPDVERLVYSVIMTFDAAGARTDSRVHKSVIKSCQRNTYRVVQKLLDGEDDEEVRAIRHIEEPLRLFERWTKTQQKLRDARGSMRIQSTERKFVFDEDHNVVGVVDAPRYFSQTLIEETALAANQAVGDHFRQRGLPIIYRVHPEKDPEEIASVARLLEKHGLRVPSKDRLTGRDIARLILAARRKPNAEAMIQRIMGLVERAVYEVKDHEDVAKHFGLAREAYLHFTSPIRRYPDLLVHRWLWNIEDRGAEAEEELTTGRFVEDMNDIAMHCSLQADMAQLAERAVGDLKVCQYMEPHIGKKLDAKIIRVAKPGITVHLNDYNVSGFLPSRAIGDRAYVKGSTLEIQVGRRRLSFSEGGAITVKLDDVDFMKLQLLLTLP